MSASLLRPQPDSAPWRPGSAGKALAAHWRADPPRIPRRLYSRWVESARSFRLEGLPRLPFNQLFGLAHQNLSDDPLSPALTEVAAFKFGQFCLRNLNSFDQSGAGF